MLIRITFVALAIAGSLCPISALIPVEFGGLSIPCTGNPRFGEMLLSGSFCEHLPTCLLNGGRKIGYCTARGICCLVTATCGQTVSTIFGYFASVDYTDSTASTSGDCEVTIRPFDDRVCQVRLDFDFLVLAPPDTTGHCVTDSFEVIGSDFNYPVPIICGTNTGQHMYLNYAGGEIKLRLRATNRRWLIRITQIRCLNIAELAPAGCLQYFTASTGTVSSFNYIGPTGHSLANQDYEICLARTTPPSSYTWLSASLRFGVTIAPVSFDYLGAVCIEDDYISILGGAVIYTTASVSATPTRRDLQCGTLTLANNGAATTTINITSIISERLRVYSNSDTSGYGFQFNFTRNIIT